MLFASTHPALVQEPEVEEAEKELLPSATVMETLFSDFLKTFSNKEDREVAVRIDALWSTKNFIEKTKDQTIQTERAAAFVAAVRDIILMHDQPERLRRDAMRAGRELIDNIDQARFEKGIDAPFRTRVINPFLLGLSKLHPDTNNSQNLRRQAIREINNILELINP
jgi:hypothetical protein